MKTKVPRRGKTPSEQLEDAEAKLRVLITGRDQVMGTSCKLGTEQEVSAQKKLISRLKAEIKRDQEALAP